MPLTTDQLQLMQQLTGRALTLRRELEVVEVEISNLAQVLVQTAQEEEEERAAQERPYSDKVLEFLRKHAGVRYTPADLASTLGIQNVASLQTFLNKKVRSGELLRVGSATFTAPDTTGAANDRVIVASAGVTPPQGARVLVAAAQGATGPTGAGGARVARLGDQPIASPPLVK